MAKKLPYVGRPPVIKKILNKMQEARMPDRFTTDFLASKLGFKGGSPREFIPLAKKLSLLNTDGTPTDLYKKFRNKSTAGSAMAEALRKGYNEAFERNEYAYTLSEQDFRNLVVEITGLEPSSQVVRLICRTFKVLREFADFEGDTKATQPTRDEEKKEEAEVDKGGPDRDFDMSLSYTINLVLPKTDDPAVFNAIFRCLRDNLLRK